MKSSILASLLTCVFASGAFADTYLSFYHFDGVAIGKTVASVEVRNQVVMRDLHSRPRTSDEGGMRLSRVRDHYFGKRVLIPGALTSSEKPVALLVSYHVIFVDGT